MRHKWARLAAAVSLAAVLTACGMSPEAAAVQEMIDQMPETYSADIDDEIMNACNALDALSEDDKKSGYSKPPGRIGRSVSGTLSTGCG